MAAIEKIDVGFDGRDPTSCEIIWRSGVEKRKKAMMKSETKKMKQKGQKMKGGRSMRKKNERGNDKEHQDDEEERKESEECLLQHPWCGNVSPQFTCTETYTRTRCRTIETKIDEYNARKSHWEEVGGGVGEEWPLANGRWPLAVGR
jgi:hypothetical protein